MTSSRRTKLLIAAVAVTVCLVLLFVHAAMPPVPVAKLAALKVGMPQAQVASLLGAPAKVIGSGYWRYSVPLRFGCVDITFDGNGNYLSHNYERF